MKEPLDSRADQLTRVTMKDVVANMLILIALAAGAAFLVWVIYL